MLSEDAIENLIQPLINRQENINIWVIVQIAKRIKEIGKLKPSDIYKLERLLKSGDDVRKINETIAKMTNLQVNEIQDIIRTVAEDAYLDTKPYFDYTQKPFIPFKENEQLQRVVNAIERQTAGEYINLSKAQAFMIRDLKNPKNLIPTTLSRTYDSIIDEAVQASQSAVIDYNTAMRRTMQQLIDSGIRRVEYQAESGKQHSQRLDTAVRRNVLDGIRAINQCVQDEVGKQFGADGKEITVHSYPAPDHAPIQGHQFTNAEFEKMQNEEPFEDVNGMKFKAIARSIGVLNCRHFTFSIILGASRPTYTQEQLENILRDNEKGYTFPNGKHLTMYQCTQRQRQFETAIRRAKDGQIAAKTSGDMVLAKKYQAKIAKYLNEYKTFSKNCGLTPKLEKTTVSGYTPIKL